MAPNSRVIAGPMGAEEGILYADCNLEIGIQMKLRHDFAGHYNRPGYFPPADQPLGAEALLGAWHQRDRRDTARAAQSDRHERAACRPHNGRRRWPPQHLRRPPTPASRPRSRIGRRASSPTAWRSPTSRRSPPRSRSWDDWCGAWSARAAVHEAMGREALAEKQFLSAGEHLQRAGVYYHFGKFLFVNDLEQMKAAHMKAVECRNMALPLLDPPGERVDDPLRGQAALRHPAQAGRRRAPAGGRHVRAGSTPPRRRRTPTRSRSSRAASRRSPSTGRARARPNTTSRSAATTRSPSRR